MAKPWERNWDSPAQTPTPDRADSDERFSSLGEYVSKKAPFSTGLIRGAVKKGAETTTVPVIRFLANAGLPWAQKEIEKIEADTKREKGIGEKLGGLAADFAMVATPAGAGKTLLGKAATAGATGAMAHQAQNYGTTGEISPLAAAGETAAATAIPVVGGKIPGFLQKLGVSSVRRGLGIPAKMMKGPNPIDIPYALENKLIPYRGGASAVAENTGAMIKTAEKQSDDVLDQLGILFDAPKAGEQARKGISSRVELGGTTGITPSQEEAALPWIEDYLNQASRMAKREGVYSDPWDGMIPAKLGKDLRQTAQSNAKYVAGKTPQGQDLASEEFARAANEQMDLAVARAGDDAYKTYRKGDKGLADAYKTAREESRKLTPLKKAAAEEADKTRRLGMGIDLTLAGLGAGTAFANPLTLIPAAATIGARNMLYSPGGGRAFYEMGKGVGNKYVRGGGKAMLDLSRSIGAQAGDE